MNRLLVPTTAGLLALQLLNARFFAAVAGVGLPLFQDLIPRPGLATGLYMNTRRVGAIVSGPIIALGALTVLGERGIFVACAALTLLALLVVGAAAPLEACCSLGATKVHRPDLSMVVGTTQEAGIVPLTDDGRDASFTAFVRERSNRLHDVAWLVTRDADDARDAVQDALAGLYRNWSRLPAGDEFEAYVHRTVVNACLGVIRRRPRSLPVADPANLRSAPVSADGADARAASDQVWRLCGQLNAVQRTAVVLRFYEDLSFADIAKAMGCREATARSHIHRAMARLRVRLTEGQQ